MGQTTQQISQKLLFPIKTRIIAWLLTISGALIFLGGLLFSFILIMAMAGDNGNTAQWVPLTLFLSSMPFISGYLLLKGKRIGWWLTLIVSILILSALLAVIFYIYGINLLLQGDPFLILFFAIALIIFVLLIIFLLDRKNFFKIAS